MSAEIPHSNINRPKPPEYIIDNSQPSEAARWVLRMRDEAGGLSTAYDRLLWSAIGDPETWDKPGGYPPEIALEDGGRFAGQPFLCGYSDKHIVYGRRDGDEYLVITLDLISGEISQWSVASRHQDLLARLGYNDNAELLLKKADNRGPETAMLNLYDNRQAWFTAEAGSEAEPLSAITQLARTVESFWPLVARTAYDRAVPISVPAGR